MSDQVYRSENSKSAVVLKRAIKAVPTTDESRCAYAYTYHEDDRKNGIKAGDTETCGKEQQCPVCHQCGLGERNRHCPGHPGVLPYLLPNAARPESVAGVDLGDAPADK